MLKQLGIAVESEPTKEPDLGRRSPRGSNDHMYEVVASDLAEWLHRMPKVLAEAMKGGPHHQGPFMHPATGQQKYEIYKAKLFNPDGTPNLPGRKDLLSKMTPRQYAEVVHVVTRHMKRAPDVPEED